MPRRVEGGGADGRRGLVGDHPLRAFHVADARHPLLDGTGAALYGGRWNAPGRRVIYAGLSYAGALLETLAHTGRAAGSREDSSGSTSAYPRPATVTKVRAVDVPGWDDDDLVASRAYGDAWYGERRALALIVPAVAGRPHERNLLINQEHAQFGLVTSTRAQPVLWDARLLAESRR